MRLSPRVFVLVLPVALAAGDISAQSADPGARQPAGGAPGVCIALVPPKVQFPGSDSAEASRVVRDLMGSYLTGPSMHVVPLDARLPSQVREEAQQKQCDHVLFTEFTMKRGGGGGLGKALGQAAGTAAWYVPGAVGGGIATVAAVGAAQAVASLAGSTKARDEMRMEYSLESATGARLVASRVEKVKAKSDGEDLVTPLVEKAAEAVAAAVSK